MYYRAQHDSNFHYFYDGLTANLSRKAIPIY
jgi:hypothetical protein